MSRKLKTYIVHYFPGSTFTRAHIQPPPADGRKPFAGMIITVQASTHSRAWKLICEQAGRKNIMGMHHLGKCVVAEDKVP